MGTYKTAQAAQSHKPHSSLYLLLLLFPGFPAPSGPTLPPALRRRVFPSASGKMRGSDRTLCVMYRCGRNVRRCSRSWTTGGGDRRAGAAGKGMRRAGMPGRACTPADAQAFLLPAQQKAPPPRSCKPPRFIKSGLVAQLKKVDNVCGRGKNQRIVCENLKTRHRK